MTIRLPLTAVGIVVLLANPGWAQSTTTSTTNSTGSFDSLSPGNRKFADALFSAQKTTGTTVKPLTKNQIANLKGTEGWGRVFKEMKADGLIQARNLGQVVSGRAATTSTTGRSASTTTTTATNQRGGTMTATSAGRRSSAGSYGTTNGRNSAAGSSAMGGGVAVSSTGGFGHAGMGGGFGGGGMGGHGGGHGR